MKRANRVLLLAALGLVMGFTQSLATAQEIPLHKAAAEGNEGQVARMLAEGADVNEKDGEGRTALHFAAGYGHKEVVALLLAEGGDVNEEDSHGVTPLHQAALYGRDDVVERLLTAGAEVNASEADQFPFRIREGQFVMTTAGKGFTPLWWAVAANDTGMAKLLLAKGADVNPTPLAPLSSAVVQGHIAMAELLLANGADVTEKRNDGKTLLDLATNDGMRDLLLKYGAK